MAFKKFRKINIDDRVIGQFQDNVAASFQPITSRIHLDSLVLENIVLKAGQINTIPHTLGRVIAGWKQTDINANSTLWRSASNSPELFLCLHCSADCTVSLEVF